MHGITVIDKIDERREEWLEARKGRIGSSEIGCIAGLNWFKSALELWAEWTGKKESTLNDDEPFLVFGRTNEPLVRRLTAEKLGKHLWPVNALYAHPEHEWASASPDAFYGEPGLFCEPEGACELKTATLKADHMWSEERGPEFYFCQLQWQLGVLGLPEGYLSCMIGGDPRDVRSPFYKFDAAAFESLLELGDNFRRCVEQDIPPDPGPGDAKLIQQITGRKKGLSVTLNAAEAEQIEALILELRPLKAEKSTHDAAVKELKNKISALENKVKLVLGKAEIGVLPDGREICATIVSRNGYTVQPCQYTQVKLPR